MSEGTKVSEAARVKGLNTRHVRIQDSVFRIQDNVIKNSLKNTFFVNQNADFYSTDLQIKSYSSQTIFLQSFPVFQENLHCVQTWPKIEYGKILKSYPLAKWKSMEISVLFHKCIHITLPFWLKRITDNFSSFQRKFTLHTKMAKNKYGKILKSYPLVKWQPMEILVLFHKCIHITLPFRTKRIPKNFSSVSGKFTLYAKMAKNKYGKILKSYPLVKWQSMEILVLFYNCVKGDHYPGTFTF